MYVIMSMYLLVIDRAQADLIEEGDKFGVCAASPKHGRCWYELSMLNTLINLITIYPLVACQERVELLVMLKSGLHSLLWQQDASNDMTG
jgi:hypothetical protein